LLGPVTVWFSELLEIWACEIIYAIH